MVLLLKFNLMRNKLVPNYDIVLFFAYLIIFSGLDGGFLQKNYLEKYKTKIVFYFGCGILNTLVLHQMGFFLLKYLFN